MRINKSNINMLEITFHLISAFTKSLEIKANTVNHIATQTSPSAGKCYTVYVQITPSFMFAQCALMAGNTLHTLECNSLVFWVNRWINKKISRASQQISLMLKRCAYVFTLPTPLLAVQWLACLLLESMFAGSNPAEEDGFLMVIKIRSTTSFRKESKAVVPTS